MRSSPYICDLRSLPDRFPVFKPDTLSPSFAVFVGMTIFMIDVPELNLYELHTTENYHLGSMGLKSLFNYSQEHGCSV